MLAGDPEAYGEIVARHEVSLRRLLRGLVADSHLADDVLQDVFLIAYRRLADFQRRARFQSWITRIAVREALGARNRWRRMLRRVLPVDDKGLDETQTSGPGPAVTAAGREQALVLLDALPAHERAAFLLFAEGWAYKEIAQMLSIPMGTVAIRIHRARDRLKKNLAAEASEEADAGLLRPAPAVPIDRETSP